MFCAYMKEQSGKQSVERFAVFGGKNLSELGYYDSVKAVESGIKPIALVGQRVNSKLPYIEFDLPRIYYNQDENPPLVTGIMAERSHIYYRPETQGLAKKLFELLKRYKFDPYAHLAPGDVYAYQETPDEYHRELGRLLGYSEIERSEERRVGKECRSRWS